MGEKTNETVDVVNFNDVDEDVGPRNPFALLKQATRGKFKPLEESTDGKIKKNLHSWYKHVKKPVDGEGKWGTDEELIVPEGEELSPEEEEEFKKLFDRNEGSPLYRSSNYPDPERRD